MRQDLYDEKLLNSNYDGLKQKQVNIAPHTSLIISPLRMTNLLPGKPNLRRGFALKAPVQRR